MDSVCEGKKCSVIVASKRSRWRHRPCSLSLVGVQAQRPMDTSLLGALDDADRRAGIGLAVVAGARKHSQASFGWHVPAFQGQSDIRNAGHIVGSIKSVLSSDAIPVIFFSCDRFKSKSLVSYLP